MAGQVVDFTDENFNAEVLESKVPVLVDFTAVWCGPCKAIAPIVTELAGEFAGRIKVGKMDIDHNPKTPSKYHVKAVPTLLVFKDGKVLNQMMGAGNKKRIQQLFDGALNG